MKTGIRVLGIDDSPFQHEDTDCFLTGVVYRGTEFIEDIQTTDIKVDANNATEKIVELHELCSNTRQIKAIIVDGVSLAGFNVVDLQEASKELGKPVLAVTSNKPRPEKFRSAMKKSGNHSPEFEKLPAPVEIEFPEGTCYMQYAGCSQADAEAILRNSTLHGLTPEAVRVAHMIGQSFREF